ncbi:sigma-70 family RNA polymerase sigma factor [Neobacillus niacini]|uniref:sigma-70 family RNA polymerase sigma factor n=1 Tax=Neobacillus niacini TaxID=86668 RepID=UPI003000922A
MDYSNRNDLQYSKELLETTQFNPTETLESIMNEYGSEIKRLVYSYIKNPCDADDVTQEVFVTVYRKLHTFKGKSTLRSWVYAIAINKCKDYLRNWKVRNIMLKGRLEQYLKTTDYPNTPEQHILGKIEEKQLLNQVLSLPIKYREVIILFYFVEFSVNEIADSLSINQNTVRTRLNRGRRKLKNIIESKRGGDLWINN